MRFSLLIFFCFQFIILTNCAQRQDDKEVDGNLNRLAESGSPYLREHADNPVDWYEWGPEALNKAKAENKPLIISIGYSSCHWCHVMEEESFMDTAVAKLMNENFVSIKIDREERPDIDQIYLHAAQLISGNGGWPLNAFALPDGRPFYAATYFPKQQWILILQQLLAAYRNDKDNLLKQAEALTKGIQSNEVKLSITDSALTYSRKVYQNISAAWQPYLDYKLGGLEGSPKFPMPTIWEFFLQQHYLTGDKKTLRIVTTTLDAMSMGGIFDQLGGGFSRYATDKNWKVPHFEKMLYDNGQLVSLYAHAYQVTKKPLYEEVILKTLDFVNMEMTSPEGGFYSSVNADSDGEEGKYYVWTKPEIQNSLDRKTADLILDYYQVTDSGNWEGKKNILYTKFNKNEFAAKKRISPADFIKILSESQGRLLSLRSKRPHPSIDDKILTSWNALMLKGYVDAYFALGRTEYLQTALTNARFLEKYMLRPGGKLWRNYKDGKTNTDGFLDDYALLARAFIQLYQATFDVHWLATAKSVTAYAIEHFRDAESGMFYYTSDEAENLIARKMELWDNVIPASNSVFAEVLYLLGEYYDLTSYKTISLSMLNRIDDQMITGGPYYANWAHLMGLSTFQPYQVAIVGDQAIEKSKPMLRFYLPTALFMGGTEENLPLLKNKRVDGRTIIYVCRNKICNLPEEDAEMAMQQLKSPTDK